MWALIANVNSLGARRHYALVHSCCVLRALQYLSLVNSTLLVVLELKWFTVELPGAPPLAVWVQGPPTDSSVRAHHVPNKCQLARLTAHKDTAWTIKYHSNSNPSPPVFALHQPLM